MAETSSALPLESEFVNVQFCPCGHSYRMRRNEVIERGAELQLASINAGTQLDAVTFHSNECEDCRDETARQERLCAEMDLELEVKLRCGTCGTPLAYEGPRARDAYCSDRCYDTASAAADEAADNRYI
jgi:hypothetical protein